MLKKFFLFTLSYLIVAFGQPVFSPALGLISACCGFAIFWRILIDIPLSSTRFWVGTIWYTGIQLIQLYWTVAHPFWYIYLVWFFFSLLIGLQFGLLSRWIERNHLRTIHLLSLAAFWTLMEWVRLFFLSGYTWNPVGLSLTGFSYPLQMVSIGGIYLLSFWAILTNLLVLKWWISPSHRYFIYIPISLAAIPLLLGAAHYHFHDIQIKKENNIISALLVQPGFAVETTMPFLTAHEARQSVINKWGGILSSIKKYQNTPLDLIALPEYVVPYGTYYAVFPIQEVYSIFNKKLGLSSLELLPPLREPYAIFIPELSQYFATNAFFAQALSNIFNTHVIIGLEDSDEASDGKPEASYSAGFWFSPDSKNPERYEKRVLVPMGEYIPLSFMNNLAASYGIRGSFTPGKEAKVFKGNVPMGISICYEETHGHLMRESRCLGAELLVNLTNDGWFPHSNLPKVHFDHARLRSVENGIPLVRACNTGITGAFNSLGDVVAVLGDYSYESQDLCDALLVKVPSYHYATFYIKWGDNLIIGICFVILAIATLSWFIKSRKK